MYITPCLSICRVDHFTGVCIGGGSTRKEIDTWSDMTESDRMIVMKRLGYGRRTSREERMRRYDKG
jgi:predicted Fe-S protein YdhL (DUF1289 family)